MLDTGLKFYVVPSQPTSVTVISRSFMFRFLVVVFRGKGDLDELLFKGNNHFKIRFVLYKIMQCSNFFDKMSFF